MPNVEGIAALSVELKADATADMQDSDGDLLLALFSDKKISRKMRRAIALRIEHDLQVQGTFYLMDGADAHGEEAYYLNHEEHRLYRLQSEAFLALCNERFHLNPAESIARYVQQHLFTQCLRHGAKTEPYRMARYQDRRLYVAAGAHRVFKLDGSSIATINNGDDGILFEQPLAQETIEPDYGFTGSPVHEYLVNIANAVTPDQLALYQ